MRSPHSLPKMLNEEEHNLTIHHHLEYLIREFQDLVETLDDQQQQFGEIAEKR